MNDIRSNLKTLLIAFGQTSELDCDFDTDLCKWKDYSSSGISWKRTKTSNYNRPGNFPVGDHTQGQNGYYSQLRSGYFRRKNFAQACFSVWYFIQGSSIPSFSIYLMKDFIKEPNPRFFKLGYQGRGWNLAKVSLDLEYQTDYSIIIEGTPASYSGVVAIDDALYKEEPCELDETTINCDFETDFICGYRTDSTQRISWNRFTGQTITIETGPPNDVTTGTIFGHFMLFEPTSPSSVSGSKAILISPSGNDPSGTGCLEFYYNANGRHTRIFTTSGDQGRPWRIVRRDIQSRGDFQILFEAIKSNAGPRGDIGLDEIKYTENKKCPNIYECNFEQDCTWQEVTDSNVVQAEWEINVAGTSTTGLGPQRDSQGSTQGYYAFLEPSAPARTGDKAQIVSPVIDDDYCLKFAYYMNGIDAGTINVYTRLINISSTRPLQLKWTLTGSKGSNWLYAQVPLPYQGPYFTFIEGIVGKGYQSYIAIDQITITKETSCKLSPVAAQPSNESTIQCSFEKDTCGWYPDTGIEGFQFIRKQGWFKLNGTGPFFDHTLENGQGWFMAAETENRKDSERARLISASPVRKRTVWFKKSGGDFIQDLWVKTGNQGNRFFVQWNKASFNTRSLNYDSYLAFEVSVTNGEKGHVAIDDLDFSNSYCPSVPNSVSCDFEDSLCGYRTDASLDYYWVAQNGTSNSMNISDHTIQTIYGQYLYAQVAPFTPPPSSKLARLTSITENSSGQKCLSFFYNMFGNDANKLEVLLSYVSSPNSLWSKKIDTKRKWVKQLIDVNSLNKHQILFEATAEGSIALDDIDYKDGPCPSYGDCNFENDDLCLWESDTTVANLQWVVNTGETPTFGTGPTIDHTFGTSKGKYIYVKSIGAMSQEFARIKSYSFDPLTQPFCFEFWYHMVGRDILSLSIYQYFEESNQEKLIWKLSGQQSTQWSRGQIPLVSSERFSIIVEGYADQDPQSDIALDDLAFFNTQCQYSPINAIPSIITTNPLPTTTRTFKPIISSTTSFDCDFESGFCGWKNDDSAQILWENKKASSSASQWQPDTDFTTASSQGSYIIVDSGFPNQNGQKARISSPTLSQPTNSVFCMHFALFMYGDDVGTFNTYLNITDVGMALYFDRIGSQGNKWKMNDLELSYNFNIDFNIVFEAIVGNGARGSFAIDDVRIEEGACKKSICDFEDENICQFENDQSSSFKWLRKSGLGDTSGITPSLDHTFGTALGHYMSIDFTTGVLSGSKAKLLTPLMEGAKKCLQFYYHMRGNEKCTLDIITVKESGSVSQPFWSRFKNNGNIWNVAEVSIKTTERYKIGFQGTVGDNWIGDIAIDDVKIEDRECAPSGFCDFESEDTLCTWSNVEGEDEFDWEEGNGKTSSFGTGPSIDHTFGTIKGTYLFIASSILETSSPRVENDRAILSSMIFDPTPARCLRFWYHMNGNSIGSLQVDILYDNGLRIPIWKLSQDQGDQWLEGTVGFSSNTTYRIYIMGIRGNSYFGDIAIDDISFVDSTCGVQPSEVVGELNSLTTLMPVSTRPPASQQISCTFDNNNICGWINDLSVELKWTLKKGSTTSSETGPSTDVSGNGYYIYLETSNVNKGDTARIISQIVNSTYSKTTNCLTFYYHLYGETIGELNVKLQTVFGIQSESLWSRNEQHGNAWLKAHLNIQPLENNLQYQILMEAIAGDSYTGDVAIDEIEFLPNRKCPPISELDDLCGFVPENTTNKNRWQRAKPLGGLFFDKPNVDNTLQTEQGYYLQSPPVLANNLTSRITTVQFDPQSDGRCLNFYMYSNSAATPLLKIYLKTANQPEKLIFAPSPLQSSNWVQFELEVPVVPVVPYNLIFESVSRYVFTIGYANLGVDDFALKTGPCRKHPGDCTFELEGLCGWSNLKDDVFDWLLHQGPTVSSSTGPSIDHTLNSDKGTFIYIETSSPRKENDIARLASETWSSTNSLCFTFWYNAYGRTIGSLKVYIADSNSTLQNLIWEISGQQSNDSTDWKQGVVSVSYDQDFKLIFEGKVGTSITGDIAIDDIVIIENATSCIRQPSFSEPTTPGPSTSTPGPVNGFDCDFETNFCGWKRESDSYTDWIRKTGETYGGPKVDHTYGTRDKYYIYFESDDYYDYYSWSGWGSGPSRSKIVSPKIFGDAKQCLKFWYYMNGANNGELNVYYRVEKQPGSFVQSAVIWRINTGHGDHWNLAHVQFDGNNQSISNFVIEAYADYYVSGQIAIDDISLIYGDCENQTYSSVDCDFEEEHICGYQPDPFADFNWSRNKGNTLSSNTGPSVDVSTGTKFGYYMYIETSSYNVGEKARLITPTQDFKEGKCLYFWYHAFGKDVGSLNVYNELQTNSSNKPRSLIWSISRDQGDRWFLARIPTNVQTNFKIIFEGVVGKSYLGDVAIDDVKMSKEQCPVTFECDFEDDEFEFCSWINLQNSPDENLKNGTLDNFDWVIDTINDYRGKLAVSNGQKINHYSRLVSEYVPGTSDSGVCIEFYFRFSKYPPTETKLTFSLAEYKKEPVTLWSLTDNQITTQGVYWRFGRFAVNTNESFRIYMDGYVGTDSKEYVAVDSIDMRSGTVGCTVFPLEAQTQVITTTAATTTTVTYPSIAEFDCDFEKACSWSNDPANLFTNWTAKRAVDINDSNSPQNDHTFTYTKFGTFLTLENRNYFPQAKINYISPEMNGTKCVEFWYYMYGIDVGTLSMFRKVTTSSVSQSIWSTKDSSQNSWRFAQASINYILDSTKYSARIEFEFSQPGFNAQLNFKLKGFVAIDDIIVHEGFCKTTDLCTFENPDLCGYTNDPLADTNWIRANSSYSTPTTGPSSDY
ncbi:MAM and LDL-receptor class A domain-containing 2-like [Brachionus plicatilis]|uniref:MAM and LDL-receptor class A domain-containing 2-like n=1 Tax=Brachionus plicatilis TaxID=10195 RepID=A0A3M7PGF9_BRAPC|nr:MAM and LDL-receptor class A domain-containing 2-like [Brachionus plicatilis]